MKISNHERFQIVDYVGIGLVGLTLILFMFVIFHQHKFVVKNPLTLRLGVLNVRIAAIVPGFSICYLMALIYDRIYLYMQLPLAFVQAYSVFCFFALFVLYAGGPEKCVEIFKTTTRTWPKLLFENSLHANPRSFYHFVFWSLLQFLVFRPPVVVAQIVTGYLGYWIISDSISFITAVMVAWAILALLKVYHVLYDHCHGLNALTKVTVIKGTIGLVLGEGFIEQLLLAFGIIRSDDARSGIRLYCFAVLVELLLISVLLERVFSNDIKVEKATNIDFQPHIVINEQTDGVEAISFCGFLFAIVNLADVFPGVHLPQSRSMSPKSKEIVLAEMTSPYFTSRPTSANMTSSFSVGPGRQTENTIATTGVAPERVGRFTTKQAIEQLKRSSLKILAPSAAVHPPPVSPVNIRATEASDAGGEFL